MLVAVFTVKSFSGSKTTAPFKKDEYFASSNLSGYTIRRDVSAREFGADKWCIPIHYLFEKNGVPVLAVTIRTSRYNTHTAVTNTINACKENGIEYLGFRSDMPNTRQYVMYQIMRVLRQ